MMVGLRPLLWPGALALVASPGLAVLALVALLEAAPLGESGRLLDRYALHVLAFTVLQATLSTVLSLVFAVPVARALARRPSFPGRGIVIRLFGIPLVLPAIVAVFGVVAVWGQNGAVNAALGTVGMERFGPIYGLEGILIAHTFFNIPLAVRLLLPVWESIPGETWRLAGQLGMTSWPIFRLIEWPRIAEVLPGIAMLAFLLTFSSFTVVLALGGGPGAATLEVAIYQALRLDFDIVRAVFLAVLQVVICGTIAIVLFRFARFSLSEAGRAGSRGAPIPMAGWAASATPSGSPPASSGLARRWPRSRFPAWPGHWRMFSPARMSGLRRCAVWWSGWAPASLPSPSASCLAPPPAIWPCAATADVWPMSSRLPAARP